MKQSFIDSNIIVYANDARDKEKQAIALNVITEHMKSGGNATFLL